MQKKYDQKDETMPEVNDEENLMSTSASDEATAEQSAAEEEALSMEEKLARTETKVAELEDLYKRSLADAENTRRRAKQDILNAQKYAVEKWASDLIEVKDNLERTIDVSSNSSVEALVEGVELTLKQLVNAFNKVNLVDINPESGSAFDPNKHQAMSVVPSSMPANQIVDVLRKGYLLGDRVLRAAEVVISKGSEA